MANFFRREAILMALFPIVIVVVGLIAAIVLPMLLQHCHG
jgi:hypothetical protein